MQPATILYLLDYTELGGGETSFLAFARALREQTRFRPVAALPGEGPVTERLRELGIEYHVIPWPRRLRYGPVPFFSFATARALARLMDEIHPRLVHANNFFGMLYAGDAAHRRRVPLVWTCHGPFDIDTWFKARTARRRAAAVACVSEAVRAEAARRLGDWPPTFTDYLGIVPFDEIRGEAPADRPVVRAEFGVPAVSPLIAVLGRFQPIKGHALLLDALPALRERLPCLRVWFIGDAFHEPAEIENKRLIESRVQRENLGACIRFLGFREDARRLLRALDALVIPSRSESFSMAAVEGLEAGIPVVGPDGWGPREIIEAPRTGLRFRPGDAADLALKLAAALTRTGEGAAFDPQAGPARVRQVFSLEAHLRRAVELYEKLLKSP